MEGTRDGKLRTESYLSGEYGFYFSLVMDEKKLSHNDFKLYIKFGLRSSPFVMLFNVRCRSRRPRYPDHCRKTP